MKQALGLSHVDHGPMLAQVWIQQMLSDLQENNKYFIQN